MKQFIKDLIPPVFLKLKRSLAGHKPIEMWSKQYTSWTEAQQQSIGYDAGNILQKVVQSTRAVRDGKAPYERDSVLFDHIQYAWPLLAILQKIALEHHNSLTLVDFGGSLGSTYFQNHAWLKQVNIKWIIVEQPHFVEIGKKEFQTDQLFFEYSLAEAFAHNPQVVLFSSVLQYLENPAEIIKEVTDYGIDHVLIDRTCVSNNIDKDFFTVQTVPAEIYKASYPCRFFMEKNLISYFKENYELITDFASYCDPSFQKYGINFLWKGYFLKKKGI